MRLRRKVANSLLKNFGLRHLQGSKPGKLLRSTLDEIHLQQVRDSNPCQSFARREEMFDYVHQSQIQSEAIDYLEFGVFQGDSIRYWANLNKNDKSRFFGFDSFDGLPENWQPEKRKGHFSVGGTIPKLDDRRVNFIKGWFDDTIPPFSRHFSAEGRLVIHIDADLYGSTMLALIFLGPFMSKGTLIIFDEFYDREHEFKALMDFQRIYRKNFKIIAEVGNYAKICAELL